MKRHKRDHKLLSWICMLTSHYSKSLFLEILPFCKVHSYYTFIGNKIYIKFQKLYFYNIINQSTNEVIFLLIDFDLKFSIRMRVLTLQVFLLFCLGNVVFAWKISRIIECFCGNSITGAKMATGRIINGIEAQTNFQTGLLKTKNGDLLLHRHIFLLY